MALAVASNVGNRVNMMGNFKELYVGAGSTILFKANRDGCFSGATNYTGAPLKWNNAGIFRCTGAYVNGNITATGGTISGDLTVTGSLFSDDGLTYQTKLALGKISFLKSNVEKSFIKTPTGSNGLQLASIGSIYMTGMDGAPVMEFNATGGSNILFSSYGYQKWSGDRTMTVSGSKFLFDADVEASGSVKSVGIFKQNTHDGQTATFTVVVDLQDDAGTYKYKDRSVELNGGIVTDLGDVSDWKTFP